MDTRSLARPIAPRGGAPRGESALAVVAYLAAYALHLDRGSLRGRILSLVPYTAVLLAWRTVYASLGYGVSGSGIYHDPARHPLAYLAGLPRRLPFLLLGEFALPRSDFGEIYEYISPTATRWMIVVAIVILALIALAMTSLWREDATARFFTTGLLLASLPVCAAFPSDRLLLFVGIGGMGLMAQLIASAETLPVRVVATFLGVIHLVLAPPLLALKSHFLDFAAPNDMADLTIPSSPDIATKTVVLANPPNDLFYAYVQATRAVHGAPAPARIRGLAPVTTAVDVTRVNAQTLRMRPANGFLEHEPERMLRSLATPFFAGSVIGLPGMTVTLTEVTLITARPRRSSTSTNHSRIRASSGSAGPGTDTHRGPPRPSARPFASQRTTSAVRCSTWRMFFEAQVRRK